MIAPATYLSSKHSVSAWQLNLLPTSCAVFIACLNFHVIEHMIMIASLLCSVAHHPSVAVEQEQVLVGISYWCQGLQGHLCNWPANGSCAHKPLEDCTIFYLAGQHRSVSEGKPLASLAQYASSTCSLEPECA